MIGYFLVFLSILSLLPATTYALSVTSPNGGEQLVIRTYETITWDTAGLPRDSRVNIYLLRNDEIVGLIITGWSGNLGSYEWPVGHYSGHVADAGDHYKIQIQQLDGNLSDISDNSFSLRRSTAAGDLEVTGLSGEEGKVRLHFRSTFPRLATVAQYELRTPEFPDRRVSRFPLSIFCEGPCEREFILENTLKKEVSLGNMAFTYYQLSFDSDDYVNETSELNNRFSAMLPGHKIFPVFERLFFAGHEVQRGGRVAIDSWRGATGLDSSIYAPIHLYMRNDGYANSEEGKISVYQIGPQPPDDVSNHGGGYLWENRNRLIRSQDFFLYNYYNTHSGNNTTITDLHIYRSNSIIVLIYSWKESGVTKKVEYRFNVDFSNYND